MGITLQQGLSLCTNLDQVAHLWGISKKENIEQPQLIEKLIERMIHPLAARCVWERLITSQERIVLWHCVSKIARSGVKYTDLLTKTKLTAEEFATASSSLTRQILLAENPPAPLGKQDQAHAGNKCAPPRTKTEAIFSPYPEQAETLYKTGVELFISRAQRSAMSLSKLLHDRTENDLWRMIHHYALDPTGLRRESDLRTALAEACTDANLVLGTLSTLDTSIQAVFSWLVEQGGQAGMQAVRTRFAVDNDELFMLLETLSAYGLAFDTLHPDSAGQRLLFIPQALFAGIRPRGTVFHARRHELAPLPIVPASVDEGLPALAGDLAVVVNAVFQQRVELTREGAVVKHCAARIQPLLRGRVRPGMLVENVYLDMLFEMAERLLLIQRVHPPFALQSLKAYYEPAPGLELWSTLPLVEQTQRLLSWWATNSTWKDAMGSDFQQWDPAEWQPLAARPLLISALRRCAPGTWYSINDFLQSLWDTEPYAMHAGFEQRAQGLRPTAVLKEKWLRCEGAVLRGILTSTLWELGLVSLGCTNGSSQTMQDAFQLTELGTVVLHSVAPGGGLSQAKSERLVLLPSGEVLLLELDTALLYHLLPYVEIRRVDRAICLVLTRSSITHAIDQGYPLEKLLACLEREQQQIPQNIRYMLRDWADNFSVAQLNHVLLLSLSSEEAARLLTTAPRYRAWGFRLLTPTIIAAPAHIHLGELRRALEAEGLIVHLGKDVLSYPIPYVPQQSRIHDDTRG